MCVAAREMEEEMKDTTILCIVIAVLIIFGLLWGSAGYKIAIEMHRAHSYSVLKSFLEDSEIADEEWLEKH